MVRKSLMKTGLNLATALSKAALPIRRLDTYILLAQLRSGPTFRIPLFGDIRSVNMFELYKGFSCSCCARDTAGNYGLWTNYSSCNRVSYLYSSENMLGIFKLSSAIS